MIAVCAVAGIAFIAYGIAPSLEHNSTSNASSSSGSLFGSVSISPISARPFYMINPYSQPAYGDKVVSLSFTLNNDKIFSVVTNPYYYKLTGSDGLAYSISIFGNNSDMTTVAAGASSVVSVSFEIPNGTTPVSIAYDDDLGTTCTANFVNVWSTDPIMPPDYISLSSPSYVQTTSGNIFITPSAGNEFINVTVTITNEASSSKTLSYMYISLSTSDGLLHNVDYGLSDALPDGLQGGASVTVHLVFEISSSSTPTSLEYNDYSSLSTVTF
jgi:hypothetical protein